MTTDNKTLADVQPGGRVRLGDRLPESVAQALATVNEAANDARHAGNYKVANALVNARVTLSKQLLALSAQPSPGGQGALVTDAMVYAAEAAYANSKPDNLHESFRVAIAAALAARQPVGEPVCNVEGTWLWSKLMDWCKRMGVAPSNHDELFAIAKEAQARYTTPPAQAVDLGQFRDSVVQAISNVSYMTGYGPAYEKLTELLALIDSHGASNG